MACSSVRWGGPLYQRGSQILGFLQGFYTCIPKKSRSGAFTDAWAAEVEPLIIQAEHQSATPYLITILGSEGHWNQRRLFPVFLKRGWHCWGAAVNTAHEDWGAHLTLWSKQVGDKLADPSPPGFAPYLNCGGAFGVDKWHVDSRCYKIASWSSKPPAQVANEFQLLFELGGQSVWANVGICKRIDPLEMANEEPWFASPPAEN